MLADANGPIITEVTEVTEVIQPTIVTSTETSKFVYDGIIKTQYDWTWIVLFICVLVVLFFIWLIMRSCLNCKK